MLNPNDEPMYDTDMIERQRFVVHPSAQPQRMNPKEQLMEQLLHHIRSVNLDEMRKMLENPKSKVRVNSRDANKRTPLHEAALLGAESSQERIKIAKYLLRQSANVNALDHENVSPLHEAVRNNDAPMVSLLLSQGAKVNIKDAYGTTPLHDAADNKDTAIVRALLDRGADVEALDGQFNSPLYEAASHGNVETIELMFQRGADPNWRNEGTEAGDEFSSAFYQVLLTGNEAAIKLFLDHGVDVNLKQYCNETALHLAVVHCDISVVNKLLVRGARIDEVTEKGGETALHWLLHYHMEDEEAILAKIALLVRYGIDADAYDKDDKTALYYAAERRLSVEVARCLLGHGTIINGKQKPLTAAICNGDLPTARLLLERGSKVEYLDKEKTPLQYAIECLEDAELRLEMVRELLQKGANVNGCHEPSYLTPLQMAIRRGDLALVRFLLDNKASIAAKLSEQEAPLCTAVKHDFYEAAEMLIGMGASVHVYSKRGKSLFSIAKSNKNQDMEVLLKKALKS